MIVHKPSGKLLLNLNDPARVTTVIPTARTSVIKGHHIVSVPHMEDEVRVLRNLGFDPPAPIEHYYDWPGEAPAVHPPAYDSIVPHGEPLVVLPERDG